MNWLLSYNVHHSSWRAYLIYSLHFYMYKYSHYNSLIIKICIIYFPIFYLLPIFLLFSHSVMSSSLQPHGLQHTRLPYPSPSTEVCSNSCPLSQWCHPTISPSIVRFSSCFQSFPASGAFLIAFTYIYLHIKISFS